MMNKFRTADDTEASVPRVRAHLPPTFQGEISGRITGNAVFPVTGYHDYRLSCIPSISISMGIKK